MENEQRMCKMLILTPLSVTNTDIDCLIDENNREYLVRQEEQVIEVTKNL